ncbi:DUF6920 family protein [Oricola indica]|jgi:hypothetical protein|uniref:DUF6920 family protein n=1 Tax=Oricola indica TaxID=2872591 RepID=UPI001CBC8775|nr:DUF6544 family protein [Oricola indica]
MRMKNAALIVLAGLVAVPTVWIGWSAWSLRAEISGREDAVVADARDRAASFDAAAMQSLPAPVRRYFDFVFPDGPPVDIVSVAVDMSGEFRRPLMEKFEPTTARQVASTRKPDLVFSADTPIIGPVWAVAYDIFVDGEMEMGAKLLSTLRVVDEKGTPELNRISLRRWLLESPAWPMALLPGGPVEWQPIDDRHARAVVSAYGFQAAMIATFRDDGSLAAFDAEEDGDLTTPYHGSGEHTVRSDYRLVEGVRIPMSFMIARAADGEIHPFWEGRITSIRFIRD